MAPGYQDPDSTVFVSNIEQRVTEEHLWELFLQVCSYQTQLKRKKFKRPVFFYWKAKF